MFGRMGMDGSHIKEEIKRKILLFCLSHEGFYADSEGVKRAEEFIKKLCNEYPREAVLRALSELDRELTEMLKLTYGASPMHGIQDYS